MIQFRGKYYDGRSSASIDVSISVDDEGYLQIQDHEHDRVHSGDITVSSRIGNTNRFLGLPDGSRIETAAHDQVDELLDKWQGGDHSLAHRLEKNLRAIVVALLLLVGTIYALINFGIPALSENLTAMLPTSVDDSLGGEVLEQLDEIFFEPSGIPADRQMELKDLFASLVPDTERNYQVEFRSSTVIGANALALPDARIVFTDQLVSLADDDEMLAAIMLHEIGHVVERHAMQSVISQAGISMLVFVLTGDISSASTALLVMLPSFFLQTRYSRTLEWEADTYALNEMLRRGMDTGKFADIMETMLAQAEAEEEAEQELKRETEGEESGSEANTERLFEYFQSHPPSRLRIERFREAAN